MSAVLRRVFAAITILSAFICAVASAAGIKVESRLDRKRHLAGEPVYLILRYTNDGTAVARFEQQDLYCMEPSLEPTSLRPAVLPVCPDSGRTFDCLSQVRDLRPGETHVAKYLLNSRFDLNKPGSYDVTEFEGRMFEQPSVKRTVHLVLDRSSERDLRAVYAPYFTALDSTDIDKRIEAVRALAGSGASFAEDTLLQISMDPRNDSYVQSLAARGLARLRTRLACARLAELAVHPELHDQQGAIVALGACGDPGYMTLLFQLAAGRDHEPATNVFALAAAAESGGEAAVDRLLNCPPSIEIVNANGSAAGWARILTTVSGRATPRPSVTRPLMEERGTSVSAVSDRSNHLLSNRPVSISWTSIVSQSVPGPWTDDDENRM